MTKKNSLFVNLARVLIASAAIAHLILNNVHTRALLLLENEICGFYMFIFVLMGLVLLFECTQIKPGYSLQKVLTVVFSLVTAVPAILLIRIYLDACQTQRQLDTAVVMRAVYLSVILLCVFFAAAILLAADVVLSKRSDQREKAA